MAADRLERRLMRVAQSVQRFRVPDMHLKQELKVGLHEFARPALAYPAHVFIMRSNPDPSEAVLFF
jgi:hypothetical protein